MRLGAVALVAQGTAFDPWHQLGGGAVIAPALAGAANSVRSMPWYWSVPLVLGKNINASGIASDGMSGKWRAQAWRMEIVSIDRPPCEPAGVVENAQERESS